MVATGAGGVLETAVGVNALAELMGRAPVWARGTRGKPKFAPIRRHGG